LWYLFPLSAYPKGKLFENPNTGIPKGVPFGGILRAEPLETVHELRLRQFSGLFWPLFDPFCGGNIDKSILPPQNGFENRLKRT
jgi:hypothetical protein